VQLQYESWREYARAWVYQLKRRKPEGPATCTTFLGIELDTVAMEMRLPAAKLKQSLRKWRGHTSVKKGPLSP